MLINKCPQWCAWQLNNKTATTTTITNCLITNSPQHAAFLNLLAVLKNNNICFYPDAHCVCSLCSLCIRYSQERSRKCAEVVGQAVTLNYKLGWIDTSARIRNENTIFCTVGHYTDEVFLFALHHACMQPSCQQELHMNCSLIITLDAKVCNKKVC